MYLVIWKEKEKGSGSVVLKGGGGCGEEDGNVTNLHYDVPTLGEMRKDREHAHNVLRLIQVAALVNFRTIF
jgi:hypothetical protein